MTTTLVLGDHRSGRSRHAEALLRDHDRVTWISTRPGPAPDDGAASQPPPARPEGWGSLETLDLTRALLASRHPVLIDCLTEWLCGQLDDRALWDDPAGARATIEELLAELAVAARAMPFEVVLLSQELPQQAWGPQAPDPHQLLLGELMSHVNQTLSAAADRVHVIVAGRVLDLSGSAVVG